MGFLLVIGVNSWAEVPKPLNTVTVPLSILANADSRTVYVFDKDLNGVPSCYGGCASVWPAVIAPEGDVQAPLSIAVRKDGARQLAYKGRPIYIYSNDSNSGDINGDGLAGIWHVVHP